jgi:glucosamine--fructose-6-phosphate aminotransferase (isomerizing)
MTRTPKAMDREKQVMLEEIKLQPEFIRNNVRDNVDRLVKSITGVEDVENVYMVGCGDSFYAAEAARLFFMEHTGLHVEAVESLEFSRYLVNYLPANSAVIGISNSGTVTRTIESVVRAREKGAKTFAVTTRDTNDLAKAAETTLIVNSPPNIKQQPDGKLVVTPGTLTYTASLTGVFSAALAFGRKHGLISGEELEAQVQEIESIGDAIEATIENVEAPSREYAESLRNKRPRMIVLGGGPNYPTAKFNVAKMYEACRYPAHVSQLEEWAHEEYFITDEDAEVFVMAPLNSLAKPYWQILHHGTWINVKIVSLGKLSDLPERNISVEVEPISRLTAKYDILCYGQRGDQLEMLMDHADTMLDSYSGVGDYYGDSADLYRSLVGRMEPVQDVH